ncbi:hypothetical protein ACPPVV_10795 [Rhodanobacter sp. Col0626]|uniref:hypothetical protein n=1 Tax=Rhodanobacter sp. Col0626 TaxID=3415679 RepID=UPI003CF5881E
MADVKPVRGDEAVIWIHSYEHAAMTELTDMENALRECFPRPPHSGSINTSNVWIIEWLPAGDTEMKTGKLLHEWMEQWRTGWSCYIPCGSKEEAIRAIRRATRYAKNTDAKPILHIEAHGNEDGLEGPNGVDGLEFLEWSELLPELAELNVATRCNLMVFIAACRGFAGIGALTEGPRAPALALVGCLDDVLPRRLLDGTKEFYRRWRDNNPHLRDIAESASQQAGDGVLFVPESFTAIAYEALTVEMIRSMRTSERAAWALRMRLRLAEETDLPEQDIDQRLLMYPAAFAEHWQQIWDKLFMMDVFPENRSRFGLDIQEIFRQIIQFQEQSQHDDACGL